MSETPPNLTDAEQTLRAVGDTSLRLLAGTVSKAKMEQLRRTVEQSAPEFPWQAVTQAVLAEDVDEQRLVQQGLVAHRDWILRGGRTAKGPSLAHRGKGFVARMTAQLIFGAIFVAVILIALLVLKYKEPEFDIYQISDRILTWVQDLFGE
jgi:outer membrane murein-binding lipoprotein Lpp